MSAILPPTMGILPPTMGFKSGLFLPVWLQGVVSEVCESNRCYSIQHQTNRMNGEAGPVRSTQDKVVIQLYGRRGALPHCTVLSCPLC